MKWFFLTRESVVKMALATLVVLNFFPWYLATLWVLGVATTLFFTRKNKVFYKDSFSINPDLVLSPVNGKVLRVSRGENLEIRVVIPPWEAIGLFLPFDTSVEKLDFSEGGSVWRWRKEPQFTKGLNRYNLTLRSKAGQTLVLELFKCPLGMKARLYVGAGDKGKSLACFGFFPLGGSMNIKLDATAKVLVAEGDRLKAGQTAIAGF